MACSMSLDVCCGMSWNHNYCVVIKIILFPLELVVEDYNLLDSLDSAARVCAGRLSCTEWRLSELHSDLADQSKRKKASKS